MIRRPGVLTHRLLANCFAGAPPTSFVELIYDRSIAASSIASGFDGKSPQYKEFAVVPDLVEFSMSDSAILHRLTGLIEEPSNVRSALPPPPFY